MDGVCGTTVKESFAEAIENHPLLLTEDQQLVPRKQCTIVPKAIFEIWTPDIAATLIEGEHRSPLCQHISPANRQKLLHWGAVNEIGKQQFLEILQARHLPRPQTWRQLMLLWAYVAPDIVRFGYGRGFEGVRIVPVQGKDVLYSANEVVRLGEKKLLQSDQDWEFLADHLIVLNQNWPRFLAEERRTVSESKDSAVKEAVEAAYAVLERIGLGNTSDANKVVDQVAADFFSRGNVAFSGCVQLAQIAAKLGASVGASFRYATRDKRLRSTDTSILFDEDGKLEELIPEQQREAQLLHPDYVASFASCSREEWHKEQAASVFTAAPKPKGGKQARNEENRPLRNKLSEFHQPGGRAIGCVQGQKDGAVPGFHVKRVGSGWLSFGKFQCRCWPYNYALQFWAATNPAGPSSARF